MASPGDVGRVAYYPSDTGPFTDSQIISMDYFRVIQAYDAYTAVYNSYTTAKTTYDNLKSDYNKKVSARAEQLKDPFKLMFETAVVVP